MMSENTNFLSLLEEYCNANGVSGDETAVGEIIAEKIKPFCDKLYFDKAGNLIAFKTGKKTPAKPIMYCAHLDEVGFMIKHINDDGSLLFDSVGIMPEVLSGKRISIGKKRIPGVICSKPVHLIKEKGKGITAENMYIDIGTFSRDESEKMGVYAEFAAFENNFEILGLSDGNDHSNSLIRSKAIDDRFGCVVMTELIKNELEYDSFFAFTVGEELGGVGAISAVREIKPEIAIIFESTTASDIPDCKGANRVCSLRNGAVVPFMDGGSFYDRDLYKNILGLAKQNNIKVQTKTKIAGGTDAASIQRALGGVRVAAISLACRYIHTQSCVASIEDAACLIALAKCLQKVIGEWI